MDFVFRRRIGVFCGIVVASVVWGLVMVVVLMMVY